jgi:choline dehydrogenase-like flavoprotein
LHRVTNNASPDRDQPGKQEWEQEAHMPQGPPPTPSRSNPASPPSASATSSCGVLPAVLAASGHSPLIGPFNEASPCPGNVSCDTKDCILKQAWPHHAPSMCATGADSNPFAVLNSNFRVRGTKGLRMWDGSAFPKPTGALPVLSTFMLSLKAVDVILDGCDGWQMK